MDIFGAVEPVFLRLPTFCDVTGEERCERPRTLNVLHHKMSNVVGFGIESICFRALQRGNYGTSGLVN